MTQCQVPAAAGSSIRLNRSQTACVSHCLGSSMRAHLIPDNVVREAPLLASLPAGCQEGTEILQQCPSRLSASSTCHAVPATDWSHDCPCGSSHGWLKCGPAEGGCKLACTQVRHMTSSGPRTPPSQSSASTMAQAKATRHERLAGLTCHAQRASARGAHGTLPVLGSPKHLALRAHAGAACHWTPLRLDESIVNGVAKSCCCCCQPMLTHALPSSNMESRLMTKHHSRRSHVKLALQSAAGPDSDVLCSNLCMLSCSLDPTLCSSMQAVPCESCRACQSTAAPKQAGQDACLMNTGFACKAPTSPDDGSTLDPVGCIQCQVAIQVIDVGISIAAHQTWVRANLGRGNLACVSAQTPGVHLAAHCHVAGGAYQWYLLMPAAVLAASSLGTCTAVLHCLPANLKLVI